MFARTILQSSTRRALLRMTTTTTSTAIATSCCSHSFFYSTSIPRSFGIGMFDHQKIDATKDDCILRLSYAPPSGTMTKIVCTIGPASDNQANINELVKHGMNVARLNFSHAGSDYTYPEECIAKIRAAPDPLHELLLAGATSSSEDGSLIKNFTANNVRAILVDTKGPEIRTGPLPGNADVAHIQAGHRVDLTLASVADLPVYIPEKDDNSSSSSSSNKPGQHLQLQVDYEKIAESLHVGKQVLLDDGLIALQVVAIDIPDKLVICQALNGGPIKKNKGVNLPGTTLDLPALTDKDKRDLKWACQVGADFVAASFIRSASNVRNVKAYLDRCLQDLGPNPCNNERRLRPLVISKIESLEGVQNFQEILKESDGIMVARGDLGVEIPYSKVFAAQKMMVHECNKLGKSVIVATQMLDSMMSRPRPTRAEVTDVGTAVLDGADACMLSGETAAGKYPIESIRSMASVIVESDAIRDATSEVLWNAELHASMEPSQQELDAVAASSVRSAKDMKAKAIVLITKSGRVAKAVARHQPSVPVLAFCTDPQVARRLQLHRAILPLLLLTDLDPKDSKTRLSILRAETIRTSKELGLIQNGDRIIMVDQSRGKPGDHHEAAHNMRVVTIRSESNP